MSRIEVLFGLGVFVPLSLTVSVCVVSNHLHDWCINTCLPWWQECLSRTSLESQKLDLMGEVSYLKLKLVDMEEKQIHGVERKHKAEVRTQMHKWGVMSIILNLCMTEAVRVESLRQTTVASLIYFLE